MAPKTDDFGLDAVAEHNAVATTEQFPDYVDSTTGLSNYEDFSAYDAQSYLQTPRSNTASEGIRTRSGRSTRQTDSPYSSSARVSTSPAVRAKKEKKSKLDRSKTPKLTAPLSVLTKDMTVPCKDIEAWVNRSAETRQKETGKRNGYIARPMNSFMLYRSAYADRTKQWCLQNNHQVVSSVSGESWPMEPQEVRDQFTEWSKIERANHAAAHPNYKFSPSKSKKRKNADDGSDVEGIDSVLDTDPDGEYRGTRAGRQRRLQQQVEQQHIPLNETVGFTSDPYFAHQQQQHALGYEQNPYSSYNPGRPVPSNIAYDHYGRPYNPQTGAYLAQQQQQQQQQYYQVPQAYMSGRVPTPQQQQQQQQQQSTVGGYGLPGQQQIDAIDALFTTSRTDTSNDYSVLPSQYGGQVSYPQYTYQPQQVFSPNAEQHEVYLENSEYGRSLREAAQPQVAIDPSLEVSLGGGGEGGDQFGDGIGDFGDGPELEYFQQTLSPDNGVPHLWSPVEELKQ